MAVSTLTAMGLGSWMRSFFAASATVWRSLRNLEMSGFRPWPGRRSKDSKTSAGLR